MRLSPSIIRVPLLAGALVVAVAAAPASAAAVPVVTSVTPGYGPVAGGNTITVNGTGLAGAYFVSFDLSNGLGAGAQIVSNTDTAIEIVVPAGALGKSNIFLGNEGGRSADSPADDYIFTADGSAPTATPTPTPEVTPEPTPIVTPEPGATPTPTPVVVTPTPTPGTGGDTTFVNYPFNLNGTASLKTLTKGTLPLTGTINARLGLPSQTFTAALNLDATSGKLTTLGFLPVDAKVNLVSTEPVTGTLKESVLIANAKVRIKLPSVKTLGIELAGGANCQAKQISSIQLKSTQEEFLPTEGGPIAGTFSISDLTGCGFLNNLVSPLTKGSGNAIALNLVNP